MTVVNLMKTLFTATAVVVSMTAVASAADASKGDMIAGGPIYAGINSPSSLLCEFINLGTTNITPISQQLFELNSTTAYGSASSCANGSAVVPNQTCYIYPDGQVTTPISCTVTFSGSAAKVRGALQIYGAGTPLATVQLR
ncbi:MAG TPA: hypothetical protein VGL35_02540 [Rhizomicrobium sp.]|jgi:hypothetical protein